MIAILGIKRVIALGVLAALCIIFAGAGYGYFMPENRKQEVQLRQLQAQISEKKGETNKLRTELDEIKQQKSRFENLRTAGFFSNQNRLVAKKRILDIQKRTGVLKASYNISTAEVFESEAAKEAAHVVLKSPMNIVLEAMDDKDIINYIFWLENTIPGHLTIDSLTMRRTQDLKFNYCICSSYSK